MHLNKIIGIVILSTTVLLAGENLQYLSSYKKQTIDLNNYQNELNSDNLKYDWVKQIMGFYTHTISNQFSSDKTSDMFSVSIDQPIFKSGGIYYGIKYAGANREFLKLSSKLEEQNLVKSLVSSVLLLKKYDLQIEKQKYLIENAKINILRKREQYDNGFLDSSFLNNAILSKSSLEKSLIDMKSNRYKELMSLKSLSNFDLESIEIPTFTMVEKNEFVKNSLLVETQNIQMQKTDYLRNMTLANYLPTVSLFAGYYDSRENMNSVTKNNYEQYGLKISMPLYDVNRARTLQVKRLDQLKARISLSDTKAEEMNSYDALAKQIEFLKEKIKLVNNDEILYDSLLASTEDSYTAGEKTIYDVNTLKNSKETLGLDKKIFDVDIQLSLVNIYAKMHGKI